MQPHEYPRRILLAVIGRSPQLVTETLYALAVGYAPPFVPTEVRIITTTEGAEHARLELLSNEPGWFLRLRPQDRLSHVLVSPLFESHPLFYYPTPYERVIHTQDRARRALDAHGAEVTLAEIPFVRLREWVLADRLLEGSASYSETVAAAQRALNGGELVIDYDERCVTAGQVTFRLPSKQLAFLGWFARRHRQGLPSLRRPWDEVPDLTLSKEFLTELEHVYGRHHVPPETRRALANGMDCAYFDQTKSKLNRALERHLQAGAVRFQVLDRGLGNTLSVESQLIRIVQEE